MVLCYDGLFDVVSAWKMLKLRLVVNTWLYTREQLRTLIFSPRRVSLAQARVPEVSPWSLRELSL